MPALETLGMQAAGNFVNEGMGLLFAGPRRKAQVKTAKKLQEVQIKGAKELTDYNTAKQLQFWKDTGYGAQKELMEEAGLNPALMYGMGGGGGQTASIAQGNVGGQSAGEPRASGGAEGMGLMMGQMGLLKAQKENIEADTKNKLAENPNIALQGEEIKGRIKDLAAGVDNKNANTELTKIQTKLQTAQAQIQKETIDSQIKTLDNIATEGTQRIRTLQLQNDLSEDQYQDKIKMFRLQMAETSIRIALGNAQKENIDQDTKNKIQEVLESQTRISAMGEQLAIAWGKHERESWKTIKERDEAMTDHSWDFIRDFIPNFLLPIGKGLQGGATHTPIKGFGK